MRSRVITQAINGYFDRIRVGWLLFTQLVQKLISGPKDLNRVRHSDGLSAGTSNERHAFLVTVPQTGERCAQRLFINKVFQLLKQLGRGGGYYGRHTASVLGQIGCFACVLGARGHGSQVSARLAHTHLRIHVQNVLNLGSTVKCLGLE